MTSPPPVAITLPADFPSEFRLLRGWSDQLARELVERAKEPTSIRWTPRDHQERFASPARADHWYYHTSPRVIYGLFVGSRLAGVVWYSIAPREDLGANVTMAIRLYDEARGKGLAISLLRQTEQDFLAISPVPVTRIWLETAADNEPAKHTYQAAGYTAVDHTATRLTMVKSLATSL